MMRSTRRQNDVKEGEAFRSVAVQSVGRILSGSGLLSLPLGLGMILGFYAADQGMPWLPSMLKLVLLIFLLGSVAIVLGRILMGQTFKETATRRRIRKRVIICLVLASVCVVGRLVVFYAEQPSPLTRLSPADFNLAFEIDIQRYRELDASMERAVSFLEEQRDIFGETPDVLSADQERAVLDAFATLYDCAFALDQIRVFYEDWYRFDPSRAERAFHLRSYLLTFVAELSLYEKATRVVDVVTRNKHAVTFLNSPHPSCGLPADSFSRCRRDLQGMRDQARVVAGEQYLRWLAGGLNAKAEARGLGCHWLWERADQHLGVIQAVSPIDRTGLTISSDLQVLKQAVRRVWFPAQSSVAEWMGDTRVHRIGKYLVTPRQLADVIPQLQPGDIMLSRKNWYLSNVGLPGFWPHAILYVGDIETFDVFFDDPEVHDYVQSISGKPLTLGGYLRWRWPGRWGEYAAAREGDACRVIEAISEGVVFNSLEHAAGDYLAALRPRLSKLAKAQAMIEAFGHVGKPYDFDFDFASDHALVCTELVWRSYRSADGKKGLTIPLMDKLGRKTLPANEIARLFAQEHSRPDAQMDFMFFLDAHEGQGRSFVSSEKEFVASCLRTKWDLALD